MIPRYPVSVKAVIEKEGRFLMIVKRVGGREEVSFPGGLVEEGETLEEALKREVREETGLEIEPLFVFHAVKYLHPRSGEEDVGIYYFCRTKGGRISLGREPDQEFIGLRFLSPPEMPEWGKKVIKILGKFLRAKVD